MSTHSWPGRVALGTLTLVLCCAPIVHAQDTSRVYDNLQVLPSDISEDALNRIMLGNLRGLGLPRLEGRGCLFCHVGDMDRPRDEWDYASDEKLTKRKARVMMAMVREINGEHLPQLEARIDSSLAVTCYTCHTGRTDPRPLPAVLLSAHAAGGMDSVETRYRALRRRYFGGDAYDFRVGVLANLAGSLAGRGAFDDAVAMAALNVDVYPDDATAKRSWVQLVLARTLYTDGVDAALAELEGMEPTLGSGVVTPGLLDGLGWGLFRQGRQEDAITLFRWNLAKFPDEYVPNESVAFALWDTGEEASALEILEGWLSRHPDHDRARRLLINLRGR